MARRMDAELYAVYVDAGQDTPPTRSRRSLAANMQFAESLGATSGPPEGKGRGQDGGREFVREKHITQVIFGRSAVEGWRKIAYMNAINRFLREAPAVDVHIVTQEPD